MPSWFADAGPGRDPAGTQGVRRARRPAGASGARRRPAVQPRVLPRRRAAGGSRGVPREAASGVGRTAMAEAYLVDAAADAGRQARRRPLRRSIPPTWGRRSSRRCWSAPVPTPTRSTTSCGAVSGRWDRRRPTSAGSPRSRPGCPEHVPGTTVDRQCGSSQQAVHFAAQAVMSGVQDLVVAGGVEVMSQVPIASPTHDRARARHGPPARRRTVARRFGDQPITQFRGAELIAEKWDLSRVGDGAVRPREPPAGAGGRRGGRVRRGDRAGGRSRPRRGPAPRLDARGPGCAGSRSARAAG